MIIKTINNNQNEKRKTKLINWIDQCFIRRPNIDMLIVPIDTSNAFPDNNAWM